jgi:hypothetical protein
LTYAKPISTRSTVNEWPANLLGKATLTMDQIARMAYKDLKKTWPQLPIYKLEELAHKATTPRFEEPVPLDQCRRILVLVMGAQPNFLIRYITRLSELHGIKEIHPDTAGLVLAGAGACYLHAVAGYQVEFVGITNFYDFGEAIREHMATGRLVGIAVDAFEDHDYADNNNRNIN